MRAAEVAQHYAELKNVRASYTGGAYITVSNPNESGTTCYTVKLREARKVVEADILAKTEKRIADYHATVSKLNLNSLPHEVGGR